MFYTDGQKNKYSGLSVSMPVFEMGISRMQDTSSIYRAKKLILFASIVVQIFKKMNNDVLDHDAVKTGVMYYNHT
jgi:hypothetical protein